MLSKLRNHIPKTYQLLLVGTMSALVAISVGIFVNYLVPAPSTVAVQEGDHTPSFTAQTMESGVSIVPIPANPAPPIQATAPTIETLPSAGYAEPYDDLPTALHNHLPYDQADPTRIVSIGSFVRESYEREEFLDADAAQAFNVMASAAAESGISLIPISGFRTIEHQSELFAKQVEKLGSESEAAKLSAPPGHSEHHTGYAIDIGDATRPDADIKPEFKTTDAYRWLLANASIYGFELSFPEGNQQGVSFEPWHWRYVGSPKAAQTFYR